MREVEDRHWWYRSLRENVWDAWAGLPHQDLPLLDIGCGTGGMLSGAPCRAIGIDLSGEALRFCRGRGRRLLTRGDAASLPFRDESFSGALMLDVLYHRAVSDPPGVLREARRVIAPGGYVIVNVPAYEWLRSSHDDAIHTARRFTRPELASMLTSAGFGIVRLTYWNTLMFPVAAAVRLARRHGRRGLSDLADSNDGPAAQVAGFALAVERALMRYVNLPFGLSVFAVAQKPR